MKVVDSHFHVWRQSDLPWLSGPMQPRIFGPYEPIRRDYPMVEYLEDISRTGVEKAVYVQANWPPDRAEDEVAWLQEVAADTGWPHGVVGYADMTVEDVRPALERLARHPLMRGVRQQFHWHENSLYRFASDSDLCRSPVVQRNVAALAEHGWSFDLQVFAGQMPGAGDLARSCPDVTFVLQHAGMLENLEDAGRQEWRTNLKALAVEPNVVCKLSGFGTFIHRNDTQHIAWLVEDAVAIFGAGRCLWGSNFPIEKLWTDYADLLGAHLTAAANFSDTQKQEIFSGTACRVYKV
jgi:predicted TIM-barrel fold metal-dependent hydrolase